MRDNTAAGIILVFLQCLLHTSLFRPLKVLPTCSLLLYIFLCLRPSLPSRNICVWPGKQEGSWRIAHQTERLGRHLFSVLACWHLSPAGPGAGVLKKQNPRSSNYCLNDTVDWILNTAGSLCQRHQSCHSIWSNIPKYLVKQVSFLFSWLVPSLRETESREDFKYQRSDNKIKVWVKMHMFYWKFQPWVDQRLASIWNQNGWSFTDSIPL